MVDIGVVTPNYNYARYLGSCLRSVSDQSFSEHVVSDAASTDGSQQLLKDGSARWRSAPDQGQSDALNWAIAASSSSLLGWLNSDEFYLPWTADVVRAEAERYPGHILFGGAITVDERGRLLRAYAPQPRPRRALLLYNCTVWSCATFTPRATLLELGGLDVSLHEAMDWDLWIRALQHGVPFRRINLPLAAFRLHDAQKTQMGASRSSEYTILAERYGLPRSASGQALAKALGRFAHVGGRLTAGSYRVERRIGTELLGASMDWTAEEDADGNLQRLRSIWERSHALA